MHINKKCEMLIDVQPYVWVAMATVVLVVVASFLARLAHGGTEAGGVGKRAHATAIQFIDSAVRSACRAEQDTQPIQQLSDSQFGLAYINCGRLLAGSDATLEDLTSTRISELHIALKAQQRDALTTIAKACPALAPSRSYAGSG